MIERLPKNRWTSLHAAVLSCLMAAICYAEGDHADWPTFARDAHRSAATTMELTLPLELAWVHRPDQAPSPAWPPPARQDYWHYKKDLHPRVTYDHAFHAVAVGDRVYFGSSTEDSIECLDARRGTTLWTFYTEGPVRLAPTLAGGKLYAGSDDGHIYCLNPGNGSLHWKRHIGPRAARCIGNGRTISRWPVRSGVLVEDGIAYCAAGLFPTSERVYLAGLDAVTGAPVLRREIQQSVQGYLALTDQQIILASGRTSPVAYRRGDGEPGGEISGPGGTYTVVSSDLLVAGRGDTDGELSLVRRDTRERLLSLRGLHLIACDDHLYVHGRSDLAALDRATFLPLARRHAELTKSYEKIAKQKDAAAQAKQAELKEDLAAVGRAMESCWLWKTPCQHAESLILAGDKLFVGGNQVVVAYDRQTGEQVWQEAVEGRACGLAAARQRLLVSTDNGSIHCFRPADGPASVDGPVTASAERQEHEPTAPRLPVPLAEQMIEPLATDQGYCLVIGDRMARLATALARRSRLRVIVVQQDPAAVAATRAMLRSHRLLGVRAVVHESPQGRLDYPPYFANLIVGADRLAQQDIERLLRPDGGVAWVRFPTDRPRMDLAQLGTKGFQVQLQHPHLADWAMIRRSALPGSGQWTHGLADPGNTACTGDQLVQGPLRIQWFGRPGPHEMADRHHRNVAPLYRAGRLFVPGDNLVIAVDAYNGTQLWRKELPQSLRLGAFLDCSNMVVDDGSLYVVARDTCHVMDVATGQQRKPCMLPQLDTEQPHHWGYIARAGKQLIGSGRKPEASYYRQSRQDDLTLWYDRMSLVTSDYLFALEPRTGERTWVYRNGVIINTTITIGGGRIYFLESSAPQALQHKLGRMPMEVFQHGDCRLVAIDLETGKPLWKQAFDLANFRHIAYINYAQEKLVVSGNRYVNRTLWYFFEGRDAATGERVWEAGHDSGYPRGGDHGEQNRHPTIVDNTVYTYPLAYDLHSGQQRAGWKFDRLGHGCGNLSASAGCLFWRGGNPWARDLQSGQAPTRINSVNRPGCFINIIPAGGMLLIPEASSGCTCGFPLQTSLAYIPETLVQ